MSERKYHFETLQLHVGQEQADPVTDSRAVPIYQTTSYVFHNAQHAADRFDLKDAGNIYGRLTNTTEDVFEKRIAALEGGVAALAVASGAAAINYTIQALAQNGGHIVAQKTIYGGTSNLLEHTLPAFGVTTTFVDAHNLAEVEGAIQDNTRAIYLETLGNPNSDIPDIDAIAEIAHKHGLPLVIDNTFGTPYLIRPIDEVAALAQRHIGQQVVGGGNAGVIQAGLALDDILLHAGNGLDIEGNAGVKLHLDRTEIRRYFVSTFWFQMFLLLMANGDVLLIKTFAADPAEVGIYSSGSVIGKISLYLANAIVPVLLPMVAERQSTGHDTRQLLKRAMLWGGGVAMLCAVGMNVVGRPMIGLLFGERYLAAIDVQLPISFYVVPVACLTILINYLMPLGRSGFFTVSMAAGYLLIFVLVSRFHHTVAQMLYIMGGGLLLVLAANLIYIALAPQKEKATV